MIIRNCSGGLVFFNDSVLLEQNDKLEWSFPKGVVRRGEKLSDKAVERVLTETGIKAEIIAACGKTSYEFFSVTRKKPVHNNVSWYVMRALDSNPVPVPNSECKVEIRADKEDTDEKAFFDNHYDGFSFTYALRLCFEGRRKGGITAEC